MQKRLILLSALLMIFLFTGGVLVLLGAQEEGVGPNPTETPAPAEAEAKAVVAAAEQPSVPEEIVAISTGLLYGLSRERGFLISLDKGKTWLERNRGLPHKVIYPFTERPVRTLTAMNVDPLQEGRVAVTTADALYLSENYGSTWISIPLDKPLRSTSYLTSRLLGLRTKRQDCLSRESIGGNGALLPPSKDSPRPAPRLRRRKPSLMYSGYCGVMHTHSGGNVGIFAELWRPLRTSPR